MYLGVAPGQAESVFIGRHFFERDKTYELDAGHAERLLAKGGFDVVKQAKAKRKIIVADVDLEVDEK
jgi:hypothetical protein